MSKSDYKSQRQQMENLSSSQNNVPLESLPKFVLGVVNGQARIPISYANLLLANRENLYRMVSAEGWFLPESESKAVTVNYLLGVSSGKFFRIRVSEVHHYPAEKKTWKKLDLFIYLSDVHLRSVNLGFDYLHLPDRNYLLSILYTLEPTHEVFSGLGLSEKVVEVPLK